MEPLGPHNTCGAHDSEWKIILVVLSHSKTSIIIFENLKWILSNNFAQSPKREYLYLIKTEGWGDYAQSIFPSLCMWTMGYTNHHYILDKPGSRVIYVLMCK